VIYGSTASGSFTAATATVQEVWFILDTDGATGVDKLEMSIYGSAGGVTYGSALWVGLPRKMLLLPAQVFWQKDLANTNGFDVNAGAIKCVDIKAALLIL
jgi:hypothetical protein